MYSTRLFGLCRPSKEEGRVGAGYCLLHAGLRTSVDSSQPPQEECANGHPLLGRWGLAITFGRWAKIGPL